jgi:hypothetical protein
MKELQQWMDSMKTCGTWMNPNKFEKSYESGTMDDDDDKEVRGSTR